VDISASLSRTPSRRRSANPTRWRGRARAPRCHDAAGPGEYHAAIGKKLALKDEPLRLSRAEFMSDRRDRLLRRDLEGELISLGRAAEILGISVDQMHARQASWTEQRGRAVRPRCERPDRRERGRSLRAAPATTKEAVVARFLRAIGS